MRKSSILRIWIPDQVRNYSKPEFTIPKNKEAVKGNLRVLPDGFKLADGRFSIAYLIAYYGFGNPSIAFSAL